MRKFEIRRMLKKLNQSAWRIRIQLSTFFDRLHTPAGNVLGLHRQYDPPETVVDAVPNVATPANLPSPPISHLEDESISKNLQKPASLPVVQEDAPEQETFKLFADFPPEIRLIVWQFVCSAARVIEVEWIGRTAGFGLKTYPKLPAVMGVCHESRKEALKLYKPYFRSKTVPRNSILINPASDIIFFRRVGQSPIWHHNRSVNSLWRHDLGDVRRIAFVQCGSNSLLFLKKTVCSFPDLEEVVILWGGDTSVKARRDRRLKYVEQTTADLHFRALRWRDDIVAMWNAEGWWAKLGRKPPVITARHWCNENVS